MKPAWIDRLLIKVALAKAAARGHLDQQLVEHLTDALAGRNRMSGPLTSDCACARREMSGPGSTVGLALAPRGQGAALKVGMKDAFEAMKGVCAIAGGGSVLGRSSTAEQYRQALELARHELVTLNGLMAADGAAPTETWSIDTSAVIQAIDASLNAASCKGSQPS